MNPVTSVVDLTKKALEEHGSASALRDHLTFILHQLEPLEAKVAKLEQEKRDAEDLCRRLQQELSAKAKAGEFVEHRGALFKRINGKVDRLTVYCPRCKISVTAAFGPIFSCDCGWVWGHGPRDLKVVVKDLMD